MEINKNIAKGKWNEIKGEVQKAWGQLTNDELEQTKGDAKAIGGLIQQKYGQKQEDYHQKLSDILAKFDNSKEEAVASVKESLKDDRH
jgi:uncharacterized protein YjbJ (UPF0337 family)